MGKLKRWIKNLKWLFNHPPVGFDARPTDFACDYCNLKIAMIWNYLNMPDGTHFTYCMYCFRKVMDAVLKTKLEKPSEINQKI